MPYTQSGALGRRVSFWDNTTWHIHQIIKDVDVEISSNWPVEKDAIAMNGVLAMLKMVEITALSRYQEVLNDKIAELKGDNNSEVENASC